MSEQPKGTGLAAREREGATATSAKIDELRANVAKAYQSATERLEGYFHAGGAEEGTERQRGERLAKLKEQAADAYRSATEKIDSLVAGSGKGLKEGVTSGVQRAGERTGEGLVDLEHRIAEVCGQAKTRFEELLASTRK